MRQDGKILYRPNRGFSGRERLNYTISDGNDETDTATVRIIVVPEPNKPPIANNDRARTSENQATVIDVLSNDRDPNRRQELSISKVNQPANGRATIRNDGQVPYQPNRGFSGRDRFAYEVSDGRKTDAAIVFVNVQRSSRQSVQSSFTIENVIADDLLEGGLRSTCNAVDASVELSDAARLMQSESLGFSSSQEISQDLIGQDAMTVSLGRLAS